MLHPPVESAHGFENMVTRYVPSPKPGQQSGNLGATVVDRLFHCDGKAAVELFSLDGLRMRFCDFHPILEQVRQQHKTIVSTMVFR